MYYYKSPDQKRANFKSYVVYPDTIGSLSRTHKIMRMYESKLRVERSVMAIAFNANRADRQRLERLSKR